MTDYALSISSYESLRQEIIIDLLNRGSVEKVVFPAQLAVAPKKTIPIADLKDFNLSMIPKEFRNQALITLPLTSETDLKLNIHIYFGKIVSPNVFGLEFCDDHLREGVISLADIKNVFSEVTDVFRAFQGSLYDKHMVVMPLENGAYGFDTPGRYKNIRLSIDWVTFFSEAASKILGRDRFDKLQTYKEIRELNNGIIIILQEAPFDKTNPAHMARKRQAERELQFDDLLEK